MLLTTFSNIGDVKTMDCRSELQETEVMVFVTQNDELNNDNRNLVCKL